MFHKTLCWQSNRKGGTLRRRIEIDRVKETINMAEKFTINHFVMDRQQVNNRCQKTSTLMKHSLTAPPIVCDNVKTRMLVNNHYRIINKYAMDPRFVIIVMKPLHLLKDYRIINDGNVSPLFQRLVLERKQ